MYSGGAIVMSMGGEGLIPVTHGPGPRPRLTSDDHISSHISHYTSIKEPCRSTAKESKAFYFHPVCSKKCHCFTFTLGRFHSQPNYLQIHVVESTKVYY